jgi:hypothetical protein
VGAVWGEADQKQVRPIFGQRFENRWMAQLLDQLSFVTEEAELYLH